MSNESKNRSSGGLMALIGILVVAVVAICYFAFVGSPPSESDMQGAIGAADKYRAEQMSDEDVSLDNPELQALLQDDEVIKLLQDDNFQKMLADDDFCRAIAGDEVALFTSESKFIGDMAVDGGQVSKQYAEVMANEEMKKFLLKDNIARLISVFDPQNELSYQAAIYAISSEVSRDIISNDKMRRNLAESVETFKSYADSKAYNDLMSVNVMKMALADDNIRRMLVSEPMVAVCKDIEVGKMFQRSPLQQMLLSESMRSFMDSKMMKEYWQSDVLRRAMVSDNGSKFLTSQPMRLLLQDEPMRNIIVSKVFQGNVLRRALGADNIRRQILAEHSESVAAE
jgi:hypothetical protein